jgi:D-3-phosphoglycerate dehydrogenase / 2-oxoglutarate reductase
MTQKLKALVLGDAMIPGSEFGSAAKRYLGSVIRDLKVGDWESNWDRLQARRLEVEKKGPEIESVPDLVKAEGADAEMIMGLFVPISSKVFDAMPKARIAGVSRAGIENVNLAEATRRGILVFNIEGRNAEAVSDFAVGLIIAESRNIARAHLAIKNGKWRKEFANSEWVPQLKEKKVGIVGFGYIGRLVARKLSGFNVETLVHDPFVDKSVESEFGVCLVERDALFQNADFVTLHARLSAENKGMVGARELGLMKPTAYIVNTARAGLIDQKALLAALRGRKIAGAALDVFENEPLEQGSELLELDNVTLTPHIAGTTQEALSGSPGLLMEDIKKFFDGTKPRFIKNPQVLSDPSFAGWLKGVKP